MHSRNTFSFVKRQLDQIPVRQIIRRSNADKHVKRFDTYQHLMVMVFAQIASCRSLRETVFALERQHRQFYHLGLDTVRRSTLSDANHHRTAHVFADILQVLLHSLGRKNKSEVQDLVFLLDSTSIMLTGHGFDDWTKNNRNRCTQGVKLHVEYCANDLLSRNNKITAANVNDISVAQEQILQRHATYVFDKGYCDYDWWHKIERNGSFFVTRLKHNAAIILVESRCIGEDASSVIEEDAIFCFKNKCPRGGKKLLYTKPLRRVIVKRDNGKHLYLVTNDLDSDASLIAETYKRRWLVELFFKWIKQNLRITRFMGKSENAVRVQIMTALIAYTLVVSLHRSVPVYGSIREMLIMIKTRLFQEISFEKPPDKKINLLVNAQLKLELRV